MTSHGQDSGRGAAQLLPFDAVLRAWSRDGGGATAALSWTCAQVGAFASLVADDAGWQRLLAAFERGRGVDSWLATDWPSGFDELLLCAPLCRLVDFECARCTIGARQENYSCADAATVFGRVGALLQRRDREGLLRHLEAVACMLDPRAGWRWDLATGTAVPVAVAPPAGPSDTVAPPAGPRDTVAPPAGEHDTPTPPAGD